MITTILSQLGLSEKDIHIYLALIKLGTVSASTLAKEVNLPRQTVYSIVQELVTREFVEQTDKRGIKHFVADPEKLTLRCEEQKQRLEKQQRALQKELPKLLALQAHPEPAIRVQYYEGREGMKRLLNTILEQYRRHESKQFRGYGVNKFQEALGDFFYDFVKKRANYGVTTQLIIGEGADDFGITNEKNAYGRAIKRLKMEPQQAGMYVVGNRVYLFSFEEQVGVMIESTSITKLLTAVFDDHWGKTK